MLFRLLLCVALGCIGGCSNAPTAELSIPPASRMESLVPLDSACAVLIADRRPVHERGADKALATSWLSESSMAQPIAVSLTLALERDLLSTGIARSLAPPDQAAYRLEFSLLHASASWNTGLDSVVIVAPEVESTCEILFALVDRNGRRFLTHTARARRSGRALPWVSAADLGQRLMGVALRDCTDQVLPLLLPAIDQWWRARGVAPRREPAVNPLPVPRSSTDR